VKLHVINLDRSTERLHEFRQVNEHLRSVERYPAVDGATQPMAGLVNKGITAAGLKYSVGAVGAALSHLRLWEMAIEANAPLTACEDDAVLHHDFDATAERLLGRLPAAWDIVLWAWSFQSAVHYDALHGAGSAVMQCDFGEMQKGVAIFQKTRYAFDLYRLRRAFGAICYTVSPDGARKLRQAVLPLRPMNVWVPLRAEPVPNVGIDVVMCSQYDKLGAFVCVPPLALAPQKQQTTIHDTPRSA
jgi:GR25 family glycosyltransferase involved in LPS biosynthesis